MSTACPADHELSSYRSGELSGERLEQVGKHVAECPACRQRIEQDHPRTEPILSQQPAVSLPVSVPPVEPIDFLEPAQGPDELGGLAHYRVRKLLGQGGMGLVFAADDEQLRRPVALKILRPDQARDLEARARFLREARAMAAVRHDHVVTIYQVGQSGAVCYLAMELLAGESLGQRLQRGPALTLAEVLRLGREIAEGLAAAHERGLVHRDVKPDNIWLEAPNGRVKLLDFGLARTTRDDARLTKSGYILGTPGYLAPEQGRGEEGTPRSDLFSLGCVLYRVVANRPAYTGANSLALLTALAVDYPAPLEEVAPTLPAPLVQLINQLMAKDPQERPESAREVADRFRQLEQMLAAGTLSAEAGRLLPEWTQAIPGQPAPESPPRRAQPGWRRPLAAGLLIASVAVLGFVLASRTDEPQAATPTPSTAGPPPQPPVDPVAAAWEQWVRETAALPLEQQVKSVAEELKKRNPGFDGQVHVDRDRGAVRLATDDVRDIAPLQALTWLRRARLTGTGAKTGKLADLKPLAARRLVDLEVHNNPPLTDLSPLRGMPLEYLNLNHCKVSDLSPLAGSQLRFLSLWECPVTDLSPLRNLPLTNLVLVSTPVRDLSPLAGMKLTSLAIQNSQVDDLSPLRGMPLKTLTHDFRLWRDEPVLRTLPDLQWVVSRNADDFWKYVQGLHADFDKWQAKVAQLSPEEQVQAVVDELARDPRFDKRAVRHVVKDGRVTELVLPAIGLDDLAPVRALSGLRKLVIAGPPGAQAPFNDLSALRGLPLEELDCSHTHVRVLWPLIGMPLTRLDITGTDVTDLSPLRGLPLQHLLLNLQPAMVPALRELPMLQTINGQPRAAVLAPAKP